MRYVHTNLIARDWKRLAGFYERALGCVPLLPERDLEGDWLSHSTGVPDARLRGLHLRLPGYGEGGPTLEIFTYSELVETGAPVSNRVGFGHIAFEVEDVPEALRRVREAGGQELGQVVRTAIRGRGELELTYARDPEGNIVELQRWGSG